VPTSLLVGLTTQDIKRRWSWGRGNRNRRLIPGEKRGVFLRQEEKVVPSISWSLMDVSKKLPEGKGEGMGSEKKKSEKEVG